MSWMSSRLNPTLSETREENLLIKVLKESFRFLSGIAAASLLARDEGYKLAFTQPYGRQFIAFIGIIIASINMGIFKWSANPVPHEFYVSLCGLLGNLKFIGKKFGVGALITLDLSMKPIISFVCKFSSHNFTDDRTSEQVRVCKISFHS